MAEERVLKEIYRHLALVFEKKESKEIKLLRDWLESYFAGKVVGNLPVEVIEKIYPVPMSRFQRRVFSALLNVPYGFTVSYSYLARKVSSHPRAVASVMRSNRLPVVLPCHRIVGKRSIGGYSYGLEVKKYLIDFERENLMSRPEFLVDSMLGDLAKFLRIMGFSVRIPERGDDDFTVLKKAIRDGRIVVTMDETFPYSPNVLNMSRVNGCKNSKGVIKRVLCFLKVFKETFGKPLVVDPSLFMSRCSVCDSSTMFFTVDSMPPFLRNLYEREVPECVRNVLKPDFFSVCPVCGRFYWVGTHVENFYRNVMYPLFRESRKESLLVFSDSANLPGLPLPRKHFFKGSSKKGEISGDKLLESVG